MTRRMTVPFVLMFVLVLGVLVAAPTAGAQASSEDLTLEYGGLTRSYVLTVPDGLAAGEPAPLLIALHPFASSGKALRALTRLDALAERDGFLVAYPDSVDLYWDDGRPRPGWYPAPEPVDDLGFLSALVEDVSARYPVDPARVVLAGLGQGGELAYSAACQMPERFARVAVVSATVWDYHVRNCPDQSAPLPLLMVLGVYDRNVTPGNPEAITLETARTLEPAATDEPQRVDLPDTMLFWLERFGCPIASPEEGVHGSMIHYGRCDEGGSLTVVALPGVGENWSRTGEYALNQSGTDTSELVVDFLVNEADPAALGEHIAPAMELWGGVPRSYTVYVPRAYDPSEPMPVIVALHGRGGNGRGMAYLSNFNELAEREGIILVYPDGLNREWSYLDQGPDDTGFLTRLVDDLARDLAIDRQRVYVTGFSNGGFMTQRLACDAPDTFAAFASVGATLSPNFVGVCEGRPAVPILLMHGMQDPIVAWQGASYGGMVIAASMPDTAIFWAEHNQCDPEQVIREDVPKADPDAPTEVHRYHIGGCAGRGFVQYNVVEGGGHTLPGVVGRMDAAAVGETNTDINTGDELWAFFAEHPLTD